MEGFKRVVTADGSITLYNPRFGESYHSVSAGAKTESVEKFLKPSQLPERVRKGELSSVSLLEVGFGLGYNLVVTLYHLWGIDPNIEVRYAAFELSLTPLLWELQLPDPYGELYKELKSRLREGKRSFTLGGGKAYIELLMGDARKRIEDLKGESFNAIYHDAFSPKRNPELWTLEFLGKLKGLLEPKGFWVTYSTALPVRRALYELGFKIFSTRPVGRKSPGTAATIAGEPLNDYLLPLTEREREKILSSPKAKPFRDPCLCLPPGEILENYLKGVEQKG